MERKVLVVLLSVLAIVFTIMSVSLIVKIRTRKLSTRNGRKVNKIFTVIFWISLVILSPILIVAGLQISLSLLFEGIVIIGALALISGIFLPFGDSNSSTKITTNSSFSSNETKSLKPYRVDYCHYNSNEISTIYDNDTVIRSDGVSGYRRGDYIHYDDGTTGHIVMLNDEKGIID